MRVAFAGAHRVGKSTLAERVADALPHYDHVEEPYVALEDEGHLFSDPPSAEDYEAQLERCLAELARSGGDVLFDRSPADFLAYLSAEGHDIDGWLDRVTAAMARLDVVVLVPIEDPDRIVVEGGEDLDLRATVDEEISRLLLDDALAPDALVVSGDVATRASQVLTIVAAS